MIRAFFICFVFVLQSIGAHNCTEHDREVRALIAHDDRQEQELATRSAGTEQKIPFMCVSLGWNCHVARRMLEHKVRTYSFPFDWNQMPIKSLCDILANRFVDLINPAYLMISPAGWCGMLNTKYDCALSHDFPLKPNGEFVDDYLDHVPAIDEKYQRRITRFYDVCNMAERVYFLRLGSYGWKKDVYQSREWVAQLRDLLIKSFPQLNWLLVVVHYNADYREAWDMPMVKNYAIQDALGSNKEWGAIFKDLGLL